MATQPTQQKIAKRVLRRVDGVLKVVYVDANTGEILTDLTGYTLATQDGQFGNPANNGSSTPSKEEPEKEEKTKRDRNSNRSSTSTPGGVNPRTSGLTTLESAGLVPDFVMDRVNGLRRAGTVIDYVLSTPERRQEIVSNYVNNQVGKLTNAGKAAVDFLTFRDGPAAAQDTNPWDGRAQSAHPMFSHSTTVRRLPLADSWYEQAAAAAHAVNPNLTFIITSAGQTSEREAARKGIDWTGTHRHDVDPETGLGMTGDIIPVLDGKQLRYQDNPKLYQDLIESFAAVGFTGIGVSEQDGFLHVGMGDPAVWDYDGVKGTVPEGVREAYNRGTQAYSMGAADTIMTSYQQATGREPKAPLITPQGVSAGMNALGGMPRALNALVGAGMSIYNNVTGNPQANPQRPVVAQTSPQTATEAIQSAAPSVGGVLDSVGGMINGFMGVSNRLTPSATGATSPVANARMDALLETINYAEGSPGANTLFGYGEFGVFDTHPDTKVYYNDGRDYSTAAGLYQINKPTYDTYAPRLGITDFSEESQRRLAEAIAIDRYKTNTGRDLLADLESNDPRAMERIYNGLAGTWSSLPTGVQARTKLQELNTFFSETLARLEQTNITPAQPNQPVQAARPDGANRPASFMDAETPTAQGVISRAASDRAQANRDQSTSRVGTSAVSRDSKPSSKPKSQTVTNPRPISGSSSSGKGASGSMSNATPASPGFTPKPATSNQTTSKGFTSKPSTSYTTQSGSTVNRPVKPGEM